MRTSKEVSQKLLMVCKLRSITGNNLTLRYSDGKDAEVAMQEKVNDEDEAKRSSLPELVGPYGEVSSFLAGNRY